MKRCVLMSMLILVFVSMLACSAGDGDVGIDETKYWRIYTVGIGYIASPVSNSFASTSWTLDIEIMFHNLSGLPHWIFEWMTYYWDGVTWLARDGITISRQWAIPLNDALVVMIANGGAQRALKTGPNFLKPFDHIWMRIRCTDIGGGQSFIDAWCSNGLSASTTVDILTGTPVDGLTCGVKKNPPGPYTHPWEAEIWQIRFANVAIPGTPRTDGYPFEAHINDVFRWRINEGSGLLLNDSSAQGNEGTMGSLGPPSWHWLSQNIAQGGETRGTRE